MLIRSNHEKAITMQTKKSLVKAHTSLLPLIIHEVEFQLSAVFDHSLMKKKMARSFIQIFWHKFWPLNLNFLA